MIDRRDAIARGGVRIEGRIDLDHLARVLAARALVRRYGPPEGGPALVVPRPPIGLVRGRPARGRGRPTPEAAP